MPGMGLSGGQALGRPSRLSRSGDAIRFPDCCWGSLRIGEVSKFVISNVSAHVGDYLLFPSPKKRYKHCDVWHVIKHRCFLFQTVAALLSESLYLRFEQKSLKRIFKYCTYEISKQLTEKIRAAHRSGTFSFLSHSLPVLFRFFLLVQQNVFPLGSWVKHDIRMNDVTHFPKVETTDEPIFKQIYSRIYTWKLEVLSFPSNFLRPLFYLLSSVMLLCLTFPGMGFFHSLIQQRFTAYLSCVRYSVEATDTKIYKADSRLQEAYSFARKGKEGTCPLEVCSTEYQRHLPSKDAISE